MTKRTQASSIATRSVFYYLVMENTDSMHILKTNKI